MPEASETVQISTKHPITENINTVPCAICRRQFSRYTCPQCNTPYCSLTCFRSEAHSSCSETFYRQEIESDAQGAPSKTAEERSRMIELLKHFEEDTTLDGISGLDEVEDEDAGDGSDLANRIGGLDIDSASYDEIWAALTPEEHERFLKTFGDPNSQLAQQLLASEELERARAEPWWEAPAQIEEEDPQNVRLASGKKFGSRPEITDIPASIMAPPVAGKAPLLLYNICAVCIVYAYLTRYFARSPISTLEPEDSDYAEARRLVGQLLPFLTERRSTTVHTSLSSVVTDLWSRFQPGHSTPAFFAVLLRDTANLLRPSSVTEVLSTTSASESVGSRSSQSQARSNLDSHPNAQVLRVLSDLSRLFTVNSSAQHEPPTSPTSFSHKDLSTGTKAVRETSTKSTAKPHHVTHKLTFYAAHVVNVPAVLLRALADETAARADAVAREGLMADASSESGHVSPGPIPRLQASDEPRIIELS